MAQYQKSQKAVVDACIRLADLGFLAGTGGNIALRVDSELFAVTPSASDYYKLRPAEICILKLTNLEKIHGDLRPSVESGLHAHVLRTRHDCNASVHTHQPIASAVALLNTKVTITDKEEREALGPEIELTPYAPSGTSFLANAFKRRLRADVNAYFLRNHGLVCMGKTMPIAIRNVQLVERATKRFLREAIEQNSAMIHSNGNLPFNLKDLALADLR